MKRLLLVRHAKSSRDVVDQIDHVRPLAPRGIWSAEAMVRHCARHLRRVDVALCSSAIRTRETLRIFQRNLPPSCKTRFDDDLYLAEADGLSAALATLEDRFDVAMLVGHEPGLSDLTTSLCGDNGRAKALRHLANGFKTAALAKIDLEIDRWNQLRPGSGRLRKLIRPKDIL